jgi:hypothetical protein
VVTRSEQDARWVTQCRDQNEWIDAVSKSFVADRLTAFVCECADRECNLTIRLTSLEYEHVRSCSTYFVIVLHHENPETDVVVSECTRYAVVNTIEPMAVRISRATDARLSSKRG